MESRTLWGDRAYCVPRLCDAGAGRCLHRRIPVRDGAWSRGGGEAMKRIMIPMRNQPGELAAVAQTLADGGIDIRTLDVEEIRPGEAGVIQLVAKPYDEALQLLRDVGYPAVSEDAL